MRTKEKNGQFDLQSTFLFVQFLGLWRAFAVVVLRVLFRVVYGFLCWSLLLRVRMVAQRGRGLVLRIYVLGSGDLEAEGMLRRS